MRIGSDAPGEGPILWDGAIAMPASGHRHLGSLTAGHRRLAMAAALPVSSRVVDYRAGCSTTPSGISPVVASRHKLTSSLRGNATIIVLRAAPRASAVRRQYQRAKALFFWKISPSTSSGAPGQLGHAAWIMPRRTRALPGAFGPRA
jgi:hypothetical protein